MGQGEAARNITEQLQRDLVAAMRRRQLPGAAKRPAAIERAMAFAGPLVRALLEGRKSQTRRPIKPQPRHVNNGVPMDAALVPIPCHLAATGQRLWVREKWARRVDVPNAADDGTAILYAADLQDAAGTGWQPGRFMPRSAARLFLQVTAVSAQRLQAITPAEAAAEGAPPGVDPMAWFQATWRTCYPTGEAAWEQDPWVWVITFDAA